MSNQEIQYHLIVYPKRDKSGNNTWFTEYEEYVDNKYKHLITYPNGIEWEQLSTTFSMPDLYRYTTLEDESSAHDKDETVCCLSSCICT